MQKNTQDIVFVPYRGIPNLNNDIISQCAYVYLFSSPTGAFLISIYLGDKKTLCDIVFVPYRGIPNLNINTKGETVTEHEFSSPTGAFLISIIADKLVDIDF